MLVDPRGGSFAGKRLCGVCMCVSVGPGPRVDINWGLFLAGDVIQGQKRGLKD